MAILLDNTTGKWLGEWMNLKPTEMGIRRTIGWEAAGEICAGTGERRKKDCPKLWSLLWGKNEQIFNVRCCNSATVSLLKATQTHTHTHTCHIVSHRTHFHAIFHFHSTVLAFLLSIIGRALFHAAHLVDVSIFGRQDHSQLRRNSSQLLRDTICVPCQRNSLESQQDGCKEHAVTAARKKEVGKQDRLQQQRARARSHLARAAVDSHESVLIEIYYSRFPFVAPKMSNVMCAANFIYILKYVMPSGVFFELARRLDHSVSRLTRCAEQSLNRIFQQTRRPFLDWIPNGGCVRGNG